MEVGIGLLIGFIVTIGVTAIVAGIVSVVLTTLMNDDAIGFDGENHTNASQIIENGQNGVGNLSARLGLIGTLMGFLIVLAAVYLYRRFA